MVLAVTKDLQERGGSTPRDQAAERVVHRRLVEPPAQAAHPLGGAAQASHIFRFLEAREELDLTELHGLEAARGRELVAECEEVLRRYGLQDVDLLDQQLFDDVDATQMVAREENLVPEIRSRAASSSKRMTLNQSS